MFTFQYTVFELLGSGLLGLKKSFPKSDLLGSCKYMLVGGELTEKETKTKKKAQPNEEEAKQNPLDIKEKKAHTINKKVVKRKMFAYANLTASKKYFRLWSISFPQGTQDEICYKLFNNWLTRLRTELNLRSYIWIAERQKNGTLHYHIVINSFLDVKRANKYMKTAINNAIEKGEIKYKAGQKVEYNGVDVSKNAGNPRALAKYITKYITKNSTECKRLVYYCSQDISQLFTAKIYTEEQLQILENRGAISISKEALFIGDFCDFYTTDKQDNKVLFEDMFKINNFIYEHLQI